MATFEVTFTAYRDTWAETPEEAIKHAKALLAGTGLYAITEFTVTEVPDRDTVGAPPVPVAA